MSVKQLAKFWRLSAVAPLLDEFLRPLPEWPPLLFAVCAPGHLSRRADQTEPYHGGVWGINDAHDGEMVRYRPATGGRWLKMTVLWTDPFCLRWEAWHGRRWPDRGFFTMSWEELQRIVPALTGRLEGFSWQQSRLPRLPGP